MDDLHHYSFFQDYNEKKDPFTYTEDTDHHQQVLP